MTENIKPLEETDPEFAELILDIVNKRYDRFNVRRLIQVDQGILLVPYKIYNTGSRNELCSCGSVRKNKHCHCMDLFK